MPGVNEWNRVMRSSVSRQRRFSRMVLAAAVFAAAPERQALAQSGGPPPTAPAGVANPFAPDATKRVPVSKAVFGDAGVIINARNDGFIEVAAAGPQKTVLIQLRTMAARAWVDSTSRMLSARAPKKSALPRTVRSDIQEYGTDTKMAVTRRDTTGGSEYALFFSDAPNTGFTIPVEQSEADVFVALVRKAVTQSAKMLDKPDTTAKPDSAPPPAPKKKKPAAKKPAVPPADTSAKPATPNPSTPPPATAKPTTAKPATTKPTPGA